MVTNGYTEWLCLHDAKKLATFNYLGIWQYVHKRLIFLLSISEDTFNCTLLRMK